MHDEYLARIRANASRESGELDNEKLCKMPRLSL